MDAMKKCIQANTEIFLFEVSTRRLVGPFSALSSPDKNINASAWNGRFPAQVKVGAGPGGLRQVTLVQPQRTSGGKKTSDELKQLKDYMRAGTAAEPSLRKAFPTPAGSAPAPPSPSSPTGSGSAGSGEDAGWVFYCNNVTHKVYQSHNILGAPDKELGRMKGSCTSETQLFLFNTESMRLMGTFTAIDGPERALLPGLGNTSQVRVVPREAPLFEVKMESQPGEGPKTADEVDIISQLLQSGENMAEATEAAWFELGELPDKVVVSEPPAKRAKFGGTPLPGSGAFGASAKSPPASPPASRSTKPVNAGVTPIPKEYDMDRVVVNFGNVGETYAKKVMKKVGTNDHKAFDWEGVRRCVNFLTTELEMKVVGIVLEHFSGHDNGRYIKEIPADIKKACTSIEETPRIIGRHMKSAEEEMTIKCAFRRNCMFMDNDNYPDWAKELGNLKMRSWLAISSDLLQMRYYFDSKMGTFDTIDGNKTIAELTPGTMEYNKGKGKGKW
jgi:hypothetical protein